MKKESQYRDSSKFAMIGFVGIWVMFIVMLLMKHVLGQ